MKLKDLTITNFMPYKGEHVVRFPQDEKRNVMVVFGENMRGKTSFLNAIRWCFYGEALDRDRTRLQRRDLANMDARSEGDWSYSVRLRFEASGALYDLRRRIQPKEFVSVPRHDSDFEEDLSLSRDNAVFRGDQIEHEINQLAPYQVSRFFLFDAELLAEYQDLLAEDSDQGRRIKEAIEQVLGVPALLNGKNELRLLLKKAQGVLAKENKNVEGKRSQAEHFSRLQAELDSLTSDLERLKAKEEEYRASIAQLDAVLSTTEAAQKAQAKVDNLEAERTRLKARNEELRLERLEIGASAWKDLLQPRVQAHLESLHRQRDALQGQLERRGALVAQIDQLKRILASALCSLCGQSIADGLREQCGAKLGELEGQLAVIGTSVEGLGRLSSQISQLSRLQGTGALVRLKRNDEIGKRNAVDLTRIEASLEALRDEVKGFDSAEVARVRAKRDQLMLAVGRLSDDLKRTQEEIEERVSKQNQLSKLMSKDPTERTKRSAMEVEIYASLEKLFASGVDLLRDRLRESVQDHASKAFLELTTEQTYTGLQINANYGLTIIDRSRRPVSVRSAGAEQIVALALIDGLNRTARRRAPIIMDTPLGRLDPRHRANVLRYVPGMAGQVVLLVHEGEIDKETGLEPLANRVGAVYEIERVSSSHSTIRRES
jgi:DNA sulfur modification protein DndD